MTVEEKIQTIKDNVPRVYKKGLEDGGGGGLLDIKTPNGTIVSQNADFAEVAEWADGNPHNEDRTGYFVSSNFPVNGIVMKKATSLDDVKGVTILAPAFAGNYTKDKLDSKGNLLPQYSYVAIIGFVPVIDNGTCTVGGRCMPDDNGCAIPSSNNMGYQVINRLDENRVLIIIEPNGDMVQRIKADLLNKMDKFGEVTETETGIDVNIVKDVFELHQNKFCSIKMSGSEMRFDAPDTYFEGKTTFSKEMVVQEPTWAPNPATKGYVDNLVIIKKEYLPQNGDITCENNTEYEGTGVLSLSLNFPDTDFICSLFFTTAAEGDINITFPESAKFIGAKPTFGNNETWELNIKNGVVVGGKVE